MTAAASTTCRLPPIAQSPHIASAASSLSSSAPKGLPSTKHLILVSNDHHYIEQQQLLQKAYIPQYAPLLHEAKSNRSSFGVGDSYSARYLERRQYGANQIAGPPSSATSSTQEGLSRRVSFPSVNPISIASQNERLRRKRRDGWFNEASHDERNRVQEMERIKGLVRASITEDVNAMARHNGMNEGLLPRSQKQDIETKVVGNDDSTDSWMVEVAPAAEFNAAAPLETVTAPSSAKPLKKQASEAEKILEAEKQKSNKLQSRIRKLERTQEKMTQVLQKLCNLETDNQIRSLATTLRAGTVVARFCRDRGVDDAVEALVYTNVIPDSGLNELPDIPSLETLLACWDVAQNVMVDLKELVGDTAVSHCSKNIKGARSATRRYEQVPAKLPRPAAQSKSHLPVKGESPMDTPNGDVRPPLGPAPSVSSASARARRRETFHASASQTRTPPASSAARSPPPISESDRRSSQAPVSSLLDIDPRPTPPPPIQQEMSEFVFSGKCGPCIGNVRCMDVKDMLDENMIVVVTAGESRTMSFWDIKSGSPIMHLDTHTSKPTLTVSFHKTRPNWLLTSDMDGDIKLWDWRKGKIEKIWRKIHTRVVSKCEFAPREDGNEDRAASCASDNSLKIWDASEDKPRFTGVNANEPFTSFVFCGDSQAETLVASLSYSIRIYKTRTLVLLHTLQLGELRLSKTPITAIQSHPSDSGFVLISCDAQLRLVDLRSGFSSRAFAAREIAPGTRIEARVSPFGTFAYAGGTDMKSFASFSSPSKSSSSSSNKAAAARGVFVWRLTNARLERENMQSMADGEEDMGPIGPCRWVQLTDGEQGEEGRKMLVAVGSNGMIYTYT
ncbi:hypothetical protein SeMB42_g01025 [Synchytrium endobioticum]|uniref:Uncharacterized protein n=1 Tax=Synchytrium endobioticum TaxID=286115 RepID=A0A507DIE9_9FUNG|nr:hypothetical protein SeLEV6574_g00479 [Synchytrium endobioticum]TPX53072.1 hypothetical protein SeMB42_g01025 [Synchytrium endobioticum]